MGCAGGKPAETAAPPAPDYTYNEADVKVYTCVDSTDDDDAMFIMKAPDGTERRDLDSTALFKPLAGEEAGMTSAKALMDGKTIKFSVVKVDGTGGGRERIIKVELA